MPKNDYIFVIFVSLVFIISIFAVSDFIQHKSINESTTGVNNTKNVNNRGSSTNTATNVKLSTTQQIQQIIGLKWLLDQGFNGSGVTIGIVDTGIDNNSYPSEFGSRVLAEKSFVSTVNNYGGNDSSITDTYGHGTEVASIAAGNTYGMANASNLVAGKILTNGISGNAGYYGEETTRGVYEAIVYCVEHNASIINLSIGQYSNIVNDGRQYIINKMSKEHNVIFTISAANEGLSGIDGGSIGTPGTAFQAITVAASYGGSSMASFSSSGIRSDYTVKPDVSAPGVAIPSIRGTGSGTSFSAPIVAGGIAVLIDALHRAGRNYTVGAIKAALVETANPISSYPIWYQGAGLVNFTAAYQLLMGKPRDSNNVPIIATAFPTKLPVIPLNTLFIDQNVPFNLTVISAQYDQATISLQGIPTDTMSFNSLQYFNGSERLSLLFHPRADTTPGHYIGNLSIEFALGPKITVSIEFTVKIPFIKVLFDETKNGFINDKKPHQSYLPLDDPWGFSTFLLGQYREFYNLMAVNNISVTPFYSGTYTNLTYLQNFDVIMFAYPNSKVTNTFTDWYNDPLYGGLFNLTEPTLLFSQTELSTLNTYVKEYSKGILILTSDQRFTNTTAFNSLLDSFNLGYHLSNGTIYDNEPMTITNSNNIFSSVSNLDYYGTSFVTTNTNPKTVSLENGKFLTLNDLSRNLPNRGRIIVTGSAYFAENYMLNPSSNTNYQNDCKFVLNMINWLNGGDASQTSYIPTTTTVTVTNTQTRTVTQSNVCSYTPTFSTTTGSSNQTNSNRNTNFDFFAGLLIFPVIAVYKRKRKLK